MLKANDATRKGDEKMDRIISRLQKEKQQNEEKWEDTGLKEGLSCAERMEYAELRAYGEDRYADSWKNLPEIVRENICEELRDGPESCYYGIDRDAFAQGWLRGVREFWDRVADRI